MIDTILDAHVAAEAAGFVAVDFYDGSLIYDFARHQVHCATSTPIGAVPTRSTATASTARPALWRPRSSCAAPRSIPGTTVFTLGRTAYVLLSLGERGESDAHLWRASRARYEVVRTATAVDPQQRFGSVAELRQAWRGAG